MNIISITEEFVKKQLDNDTTGHDWHHIDRVRKMALFLWKHENQNYSRVVELAALLHDIGDEKLNVSKESGEKKLLQFLEILLIEDEEKKQILSIISSIGFKGGNGIVPETLEAKVVQDADRLDAIGAIGIARTFAYGGHKGSPIYNPDIEIREEMTEKEYRNGNSSSINHFYEKLLKLKDGLHTESAKRIAEDRHQIMVKYLDEFFIEWNGRYEEYFN